MSEIIIFVGLAFTFWMALDCVQRREHFVWIIVMFALFPVGAVAYYFAVKGKDKNPLKIFPGGASREKEVETEETLQLKDLTRQFHKAYHYEKLGQAYLDQKKYDLAIPQFEEAIKRDEEMEEARYGLGKSYYGQGRYGYLFHDSPQLLQFADSPVGERQWLRLHRRHTVIEEKVARHADPHALNAAF